MLSKAGGSGHSADLSAASFEEEGAAQTMASSGSIVELYSVEIQPSEVHASGVDFESVGLVDTQEAQVGAVG